MTNKKGETPARRQPSGASGGCESCGRSKYTPPSAMTQPAIRLVTRYALEKLKRDLSVLPDRTPEQESAIRACSYLLKNH